MDDRELARRWVGTWRAAAPELERIRREEVRRLDTLEALAALEEAFNHAHRSQPPRPSSGMVETQAYFAMLRR